MNLTPGLFRHLRLDGPQQHPGRQHGLRVLDLVQPPPDSAQHPPDAHRLLGPVPSLGPEDQQVHERRRTGKASLDQSLRLVYTGDLKLSISAWRFQLGDFRTKAST